MSNSAEIVFAGNAQGVLDEMKKMEKAHDQQIEKMKASLKVSKQAANEEKKLRQEVAAAIEKAKTPAEAYNATLNRYKQALQAGMISAEQFNRLRDKELAKLNAATAATMKNVSAVNTLKTAQETSSVASGKFADGFAMIATKALLAVQAVKTLVAEQKRMQDEAAGTVATVDDLSREYAIQGGLKTEDQRKEATKRILATARDNASTPAQAFGTASQLASSGFDAPDSTSLDSALKILQTSDMAKADPKGYIDSAAKYLKASNQQLTGKNLLEIGVAMRGLVDTPVQASDLAEFSEAAPVLNMQGTDWKTGLAMMTELRRAFSGATAGTKMRNIGQRLATASTDKQAMEALDELGLKPEQIDSVGESMPDALRVLKKAVYAQPVEKQAGILGRIFNNENVPAADVLMKNIDAVDKNLAAMNDTSLFTAGVNFKMQGYNAQMNRAEIDKQQAQLDEEARVTDKAVLLKEVETNRIRRMGKQGVFKNTYDTVFQNTKDDLMNSIGAVSDEELLQRSKTGVQLFNGYESEQQRQQTIGGLNKGGTVFTEEDLMKRRQGDPQAPAMAEQNRLLKQISDKLTPPVKPTENPNTQGRP